MHADGMGGSLSGGGVERFAGFGVSLVAVLIGVAFGQVVAVVAGSMLRPDKSLNASRLIWPLRSAVRPLYR